jgi:hypothetical protein
MSALSKLLEILPYSEGKIAIYRECRAKAIEHADFWRSPDRSAKGLTTDKRAEAIFSAEQTVIRCDAMIKYWQRPANPV